MGSLDGSKVRKEVLDLMDRCISMYEVVENIVDSYRVDGQIWLRLLWERLSYQRNFTWNKIQEIYRAIPYMMKQYLESLMKCEPGYGTQNSGTVNTLCQGNKDSSACLAVHDNHGDNQ